jgi:hypothetical protein
MAFSTTTKLLLLAQLPFLVECHLKFNSILSETSHQDQINRTSLANRSELAVLTHGSSTKKTNWLLANLRP